MSSFLLNTPNSFTFKEMNTLYDEIHGGMEEFKLLANEAWNGMALTLKLGQTQPILRFSESF